MGFYSKFVFLCGVYLCGHLFAQETLTGLQNEIARVEREIQREKDLHQKEIEKYNEFEKRKKEKLAQLEEQNKSLAQASQEIKASVLTLRQEKASAQAQLEKLRQQRKTLSQRLISDIQKFLNQVQVDFPAGKEQRIALLNKLRDDLSSGQVSAEEGMQRFLALLNGALELGWTTEIYSGTYRTQQGPIVDGKYLRLGAILLAFNSLDGNTTAFLVPQSALTDTSKNKASGNDPYIWIENTLSIQQKQAIKRSFEVMEGKAAPELAKFPLYAPAEKGGLP